MPLWALWRRNLAVWLMPVTVAVVLTIRAQQADIFDGYAPWVAAQQSYSLVLLGMLTALAGAAEGVWVKRAGLTRLPARRGARFALPVVLSWFPTALLMLLVVTLRGGLSAWQVWGSSLAALLAWTGVGFVLGFRLRAALALPLSVVAAFIWFAFTPAIHPEWVRHLSGTWDGCCDISQRASTVVAVGCSLLALALLGASWLACRVGLRWLLAAMLVLALGFGAAGWLVRDVGYFPVVERSDELTCYPGEPEVCLWPERTRRGQEVTSHIWAVTDRWRALDVSLPDTLSEAARQRPQSGTALLAYGSVADPGLRAQWLAQGIATACDGEEELDDLVNYFVVKDWLTLHSGVPGAEAYLSDPISLRHLQGLPADRQVELVNEYLTTAWECE